MNLSIEFPDLLLSDIIERTIRRYLHESSDGYEFLQLHVQRQLKDEISRQVEAIDLEAEVRSFVRPSLQLAIERAVEKELERRVKSATQRVLAQKDG
jgi:glucose-6-phosphate-specific signal transduction histidine kinase